MKTRTGTVFVVQKGSYDLLMAYTCVRQIGDRVALVQVASVVENPPGERHYTPKAFEVIAPEDPEEPGEETTPGVVWTWVCIAIARRMKKYLRGGESLDIRWDCSHRPLE